MYSEKNLRHAARWRTLTEIAKTLNKEEIPSPLMLRKMRKDNFPCNRSNEITYWRAARIQAILKDRRYVGTLYMVNIRETKLVARKI